ncbi:MAG: dienelactone hydrolase family protein [Gammaproteobacteria bacterium]
MNISRLSLLALTLGMGLFTGLANAEIVTRNIEYQQGDTVMKGMLAYDDAIKGKRPGVLVVHEWWGQNDYPRERARQLAALGYTAFALDMYGEGMTAEHPKDAGTFANAVGGDLPLAKARFEAALDALKQQTSVVDANKIAAIGYCFGGGIVLQMARLGEDLKGVASFHGSVASKIQAERGKVKAAVRVFNGAADPMVKPEQIEAFEREMFAADVDYKVVNYADAKHGFTNPGATALGKKFDLPLAYNEHADKDSWAQMQAFFKEIFK